MQAHKGLEILGSEFVISQGVEHDALKGRLIREHLIDVARRRHHVKAALRIFRGADADVADHSPRKRIKPALGNVEGDSVRGNTLPVPDDPRALDVVVQSCKLCPFRRHQARNERKRNDSRALFAGVQRQLDVDSIKGLRAVGNLGRRNTSRPRQAQHPLPAVPFCPFRHQSCIGDEAVDGVQSGGAHLAPPVDGRTVSHPPRPSAG